MIAYVQVCAPFLSRARCGLSQIGRSGGDVLYMPSHVFLKNPDAVIGPGDTIRLPAFTGWAPAARLIYSGAIGGREPHWSGIFGRTGGT